MNLLVDARYDRPVRDLWLQHQRGLLPPKRPGELRFDPIIEPPMHGPDARNFLKFIGVPEEFARLLTQKGIPYIPN
jgi:hypothetical protein